MFGVFERVYRGSINKNRASCINLPKFANSAFLSVGELIRIEVLSESAHLLKLTPRIALKEERTERKKMSFYEIFWPN